MCCQPDKLHFVQKNICFQMLMPDWLLRNSIKLHGWQCQPVGQSTASVQTEIFKQLLDDFSDVWDRHSCPPQDEPNSCIFI